jgi:hypothetical protein
VKNVLNVLERWEELYVNVHKQKKIRDRWKIIKRLIEIICISQVCIVLWRSEGSEPTG